MKGNLLEHATHSFRHALALSPMLWEAFEGLCSLGNDPELMIMLCNSLDFHYQVQLQK